MHVVNRRWGELIKAKKKGAITTQRGKGQVASIDLRGRRGRRGRANARRSKNQSSREEEANQRKSEMAIVGHLAALEAMQRAEMIADPET